MDLVKSSEYFQPESVTDDIHIIGCGAVGSTIAEQLVRLGLTHLHLYDFDTVEAHNVANQMFRDVDIGKEKVRALADMLIEINPAVEQDVRLHTDGWKDNRLSGYVFLCVDNIELRHEIAEKNQSNSYIKAMFDVRIRLEDAQHYATAWNNDKAVKNFLESMNFTHEEAMESTPVGACNVTLSVAPTVRVICAYCVTNFMNFVKNGTLKTFMMVNPFSFKTIIA
ncbi:MAG TPA: ThiF family adenylyltransferase [Saprospiraceae bacterium]|nr:ThiF family adenylyltransferase [Saprospiraceae bacterium]